MKINELEIKRKLIHLIVGLIIVVFIDLGIITELVLGIIFILGLLTSVASKKFKIPIIYNILEKVDRKKDLRSLPGSGALFFVAGCFLSVFLFEKNIALGSIMILTIGDAVSSLIGIHFGSIEHPLNKKKLIEGTIAGIVLAFLGTLLFLNYKEALFASVLGMIAESIEIRYDKFSLNDNITVPLVAGLSVYLLRLI